MLTGRRTTYVKNYNKIELAISATIPSDSGIYQCVAVNSAGEIWAAGRLQVNTSRNSPAAPTLLNCQALSPVRILISWEPPKSLSYTSITAYTVHYSAVGEFDDMMFFYFLVNSERSRVKCLHILYIYFCGVIRRWQGRSFSTRTREFYVCRNNKTTRTVYKLFILRTSVE